MRYSSLLCKITVLAVFAASLPLAAQTTNTLAGTIIDMRTFASASNMLTTVSNVVLTNRVASNYGGRYLTVATDKANQANLNVVRFTNTLRNFGNHDESFELLVVARKSNVAAPPLKYSVWFEDSSQALLAPPILPVLYKSTNRFILAVRLTNASYNDFIEFRVAAQAQSGFNVTATNYIGDNTVAYGGDVGDYWTPGYTVWKTNAPVTSRQDNGYIRVTIGDTTPPTSVVLQFPTNNEFSATATPIVRWSQSYDPGGSGVTFYVVSLSTNAGFSGTIVSNTLAFPTTNWTTTTLSNRKYYWRARSRDLAGNIGNWSGVSNFTVDTKVPTAPTLILPPNAKITNGTSINLVWTKSVDANLTNYRVFTNGVLAGTVPWSQTNFTIAATIREGTHTWRVKPVDKAGNTNVSLQWTFIVDRTPPSVPVLIQPANNDYTNNISIGLLWNKSTDGGSGVTNYQIFTNGRLAGTVSWSITNFTVGPTIREGVHTWRIKPYDRAGMTNVSLTWTFTVDRTPPSVPTLILPPNAKMTNGTSIGLLWQHSNDANLTNYRVYTNGVLAGTTVAGVTNFTIAATIREGTHTWRIKPVDKAGNTNVSAQWTFIIDRTAPSAPGLVSPLNNEITNASTIGLVWNKSTDAGSGITNYQVYTNGVLAGTVPWSQSNFTLGPGIREGVHSYRIKSFDRAGMTNVSVTWIFTVDRTPPSVPTLILLPNGKITNATAVGLLWNKASDALSGVTNYQVFTNGRLAGTTGAGVTNFTIAATIREGTHTWRIKPIDRAGNTNVSAQWTFIIDRTAPSAPGLVSPLNNEITNASTIGLVWNKSTDAGSGITNYQVYTNGVLAGTVPWSQTNFTLGPGIREGVHSYRVKSFDRAGMTNVSVTWIFTVDRTPPSVPTLILLPNGKITNATAVGLLWNKASDALSGVTNYQVFTNGRLAGTTVAGVTNFTIAATIREGLHTWRIKPVDKAGNTNVSAQWTFIIDRTAPSAPGLVTPLNNKFTNASTIGLVWNKSTDAGSGITNYQVFTNGRLAGTTSWSVTNFTLGPGIREGVHTYRVKSFDRAGMTNVSVTWIFTVDRTAPSVPTLILPPNNKITNATAVGLLWNKASDALSGVTNYQVYTNGVLAGTTGGSVTNFTIAALIREGLHTWRIKPIDRAGNTNVSAQWTFIIDRTAPSAPGLVSPLNNEFTNASTIGLVWNKSTDSGSGITNYQVFTNGRLAGTTSWSVTNFTIAATIREGVHTWRIKPYDRAGMTNVSVTWIFTVDRTPPGVPTLILPPNNKITNGTSIGLLWNKASDALSGITNYQVYTNGVLAGTTGAGVTNFTIAALIREGLHTWRIKPVDRAGNTNVSLQWTFIIDRTVPSAPGLVTPLNNEITNGSTIGLVWNKSTDAGSGITNYQVFTNGRLAGTTSWSVTNFTLGPGIREGVHTYRVKSFDRAGMTNVSVTWIFTVDRTAPSVPTLILPPNNTITNGTSIGLLWNKASDALSGVTNYQVFTNGRLAGTTGGSVTNFTIAALIREGLHTWRIKPIDRAGNTNVSLQWTFIIDRTAPSAPGLVTPLNNRFTNGSSIGLVWNKSVDPGSGITNYQVFTNGRLAGTTSWSVTNFTIAATIREGVHTWRIKPYDRAGNTNVSVTWAFTVDRTVPTAPNLVLLPNGKLTNATAVGLLWNKATDSLTGITNYQVFTNGVVAASLSWSQTNLVVGPTIREGTHTWRVKSWDRAGNTNVSLQWSFIIDRTGPTAPLLVYPKNNKLTNNTTVNLRWKQASDANGILQYLVVIDASATTNLVVGTSSNFSSVLAQGNHTWQVRARDNTGNLGAWSSVSNFTVDTIAPPVVLLQSPISNSTISLLSTVLQWNASLDAVTGVSNYIVQYSTNASFAASFQKVTNGLAWSIAGLKNNSTNYWRVRAFDRVANTNAWSSVWRVMVDTNQLVPVLQLPANGAFTNSINPSFLWSSLAGAGRYKIELRTNNISGRVIATNTNVLINTVNLGVSLRNGLYDWRVRAWKTSTGVWQLWSGDFTFTVDTNKPAIPTLISPAVSATNTVNNITFLWQKVVDIGSSIKRYEINIDSATNDALTATNWAAILAQGPHTWKVRAIDQANNTGAWSGLRTLVIDTNDPAAPNLVMPLAAAITNDPTPSFLWNRIIDPTTGIRRYEVQVGSTVYNAGTSTNWTYPSTWVDGSSNWQVRAIDNAGNIGAWSAARSLTVDSSAPAAPVVYAPAAGAFTNDATPSFRWGRPADATGIAVFEVLINTTVYTTSSTNWTYPNSWVNGSSNWQVRAIDNAGNVGTLSGSRSLTVDATAPGVVTLIMPAAAAVTNDNTPAFLWQKAVDVGSGIKLYEVRVGNSTNYTTVNTNWTYPTTFVNGTSNWTVRAVDNANNRGPWAGLRSLQVDATAPPQVTLIRPADLTITNDSTPGLLWQRAVDVGSGVKTYEVQIGATIYSVGTVTNWSYPSTWVDGTSNWQVRAIDNANNAGLWSVVRSLSVDTTPPALVTLVSPASNTTLPAGNAILTWNLTTDNLAGVSGYMIQRANNPAFSVGLVTKITNAASAAWSVSGLANNSTNYWRVRAWDLKSNTNAWSSGWRFMINTNQIITTLISPAAGAFTNNNDPNYLWTAMADASYYWVQVMTNGATLKTEITNAAGPLVSLAALNNGVYSWRVRVYKTSTGQWQSWSGANTFTVDTVLPSTPVQLSPANGALTNDNTPTFAWNAATDNTSIKTYQLQVGSKTTNVGNVTGFGWPFALADGVSNWQVRAIDMANNVGAWSGFWAVTIDTNKPSVPAVIGPANAAVTNDNTPSFLWQRSTDANGVSGYQIKIAGTTYNTGTATNWTYPTTWVDGSSNWQVRAIDNAGNVGNWTGLRSLVVDTTAPAIVNLLKPAAGTVTNDSTPALVWNKVSDATGIAYYEVLINTTVYTTSATNWTYPTTWVDGASNWNVRAVDNAANTGGTAAARTLTVDTTGPATVVLASPSDGFTSASLAVTLAWNATTDLYSAVTTYVVQRANNPSFTGPVTKATNGLAWNVSIPNAATNWWRVRAVDSKGNTNAWSAVWRVSVDTNQIVPTLHSPLNAADITDNTPDLIWSSESGVTRYEVEVRANTIAGPVVFGTTNVPAGTTNVTSSALTNGVFAWHVRAYKTSTGQWQSWSSVRTFTVDTTPPAAPILLTPANAATTNDVTPTFAWNRVNDLTGILRYEIQIGSTIYNAATATNWIYPTTWVDGASNWQVRAIDNAGNTGAWSATRSLTVFTVDVTPPSAVVLVGPANNTWVNNWTPSVTFTHATDAGGGSVTYRVEFWQAGQPTNSVTAGSGITNTALALTNDGTWSWRVYSIDATGNETASAAVRTVRADTTPPTLTLTPTSTSYSAPANVTMAWSASDAGIGLTNRYILEYSPDGFSTVTSVTQSAASLVRSFTNGIWDWRVTAFDRFGWNTTVSSVSSFTMMDLTAPPAVTLSGPTNNAVVSNATPTFTWNAVSDTGGSGVASYDIRFNSGTAVNVGNVTSWDYPTAMLTGVSNWQVRAIDGAGNTGAWSTARNLEIDRTGPVVTLANIGTTFPSPSTVGFAWTAVDAGIGVVTVSTLEYSPNGWATVYAVPATSPHAEVFTNGTWQWRVKAYDSFGWQGISSVSSFTMRPFQAWLNSGITVSDGPHTVVCGISNSANPGRVALGTGLSLSFRLAGADALAAGTVVQVILRLNSDPSNGIGTVVNATKVGGNWIVQVPSSLTTAAATNELVHFKILVDGHLLSVGVQPDLPGPSWSFGLGKIVEQEGVEVLNNRIDYGSGSKAYIRYTVEGASAVKVNISIFNIAGEFVKNRIDEIQDPGTYTTWWDGKNANEQDAGRGVYFVLVKFSDNKYPPVKKIIVR